VSTQTRPQSSPFGSRRRPRLLDLFCCEGGAGTGYAWAGFEVVGVDIAPQPHYPYEFIQGGVLEYLTTALAYERKQFDKRLPFAGFDAIHASPPCQSSTTMSNRWRGKGGKADSHENLINATRELLDATGLPYVIENVPGAKPFLNAPVVLTGEMFGLGVHRPRLFETNWPLVVPPKPKASPNTIGVYGKAPDGRLLWRRKDGTEQRAASSLEEGQQAMGMPWASWRGVAEAIPPAYTHFVGAQLFAFLHRTQRQEVAA
jgi:DNA (cytosine-5)-methyltransferase 1